MYLREYRKRNPEKAKEKKQRWHEAHPGRRSFQHWKGMLKKNFGLTVEEYQVIQNTQNNLCLICGNPETKTSKDGNIFRLSIDHCHLCSVIRGLLCQRCNALLGFVEEDIEVLERAILFIKEHNKECQ